MTHSPDCAMLQGTHEATCDCATPLPAPDPMDEVVGRVREGIESAVVQAFANGAPEFAPRDFDALCYGATRGPDIGNTLEEFHQFGQLRVSDLRALLAAYQSVREDKARLDWLEDHGGFETPDGKDGMSMARWGRSSDLTLRTAIDRARTGGTE